MNYYQGEVVEYLRSDRAIFVNTECCIQLHPDTNPKGGEHWFCDVVACDFRNQTAFLCEISYSKQLTSLIRRLREWHQNWDLVCAAMQRDCRIPKEKWTVRTWLFVPEDLLDTLLRRLRQIADDPATLRFRPKITTLEATLPWKRSWNWQGEAPKSDRIPESMRD